MGVCCHLEVECLTPFGRVNSLYFKMFVDYNRFQIMGNKMKNTGGAAHSSGLAQQGGTKLKRATKNKTTSGNAKVVLKAAMDVQQRLLRCLKEPLCLINFIVNVQTKTF